MGRAVLERKHVLFSDKNSSYLSLTVVLDSWVPPSRTVRLQVAANSLAGVFRFFGSHRLYFSCIVTIGNFH